MFEKFICSPYFSTGRDISGLYSHIKKFHPEFNSEEMERENIYSKLFPGEEFNERKLKNLTASLTSLAEQFLIHNTVKSQETDNKILLAGQYLERGNEKLFLSTLKAAESDLSPENSIGTDSFDKEKRILRLKEKFYLHKNKFNDSVPCRLSHAEYSIVSFYIYYFKRLKDTIILPLFYNIPFNNSPITAIEASIDFEKNIKLLKEENYPLLWLIEIYYNIYKALLHHKWPESEDYYRKYKSLFLYNIEKFSRAEKCYIFDAMATYCVMRDPENRAFTKECVEVYKLMLDENAYSASENEPMGASMYGNIMLWALDSCEYDWLEEFIEKYSVKLADEYRDNMTHFAMANLCFGRSEFEKALGHISRVQTDFLVYKIQVRNLKFKIYYELGMFEQAYSMVDSYRHFLSQNTEIHETFKVRAMDFINIYTRLLRAKALGNFSELEVIRKKIDSMLGYELRPWLTEKVNELAVN